MRMNSNFLIFVSAFSAVLWGKETESAAVPPEAVPQGEKSCKAVDAIQAPYHAVGDAAKPVGLPVSEAVADA
eukprot:5279646-Pleurochrysis_carterae.AAC.1